MIIRTIALSSSLMLLLFCISGVAQDDTRTDFGETDRSAEPAAQERGADFEPGLFDEERQRERRDLLARQEAEQPRRLFPNAPTASAHFLDNQRANQAPSNLATTGIANLTQTAPFARSINGSPYSAKLAKINQETASGVRTLVQKIKKSDSDDEKEELKNEIHSLLDAQYDAYLDHHEEPLKQLEARLNKLREEFEARKKAKTDLVKLRLDTVWYDAIGLGWPGNTNGGATYFAPGLISPPARFAPSGFNNPSARDPRTIPLGSTSNLLFPPPLKGSPGFSLDPAAIPAPPKSNDRPDFGEDVPGEPERPSRPGRPIRSGSR